MLTGAKSIGMSIPLSYFFIAQSQAGCGKMAEEAKLQKPLSPEYPYCRMEEYAFGEDAPLGIHMKASLDSDCCPEYYM